MASWDEVIPDFRAKAAQFQDIVARVEASAPTTVALMETKRALLATAAWIKKTIQMVTGAIDAVANVFGIGTLGIVPLIPIAVVVVAVAAMTKFIADAIQYLNKIDVAKQAQAQGATPDQVANIMAELPTVTTTARAMGANWLPITLAGGLAVYLLTRKRGEKMK